MFQLIYTSRATQDFTAADLKELLLRLRLNNKKVNVTGMLIYRDGAFLQALEGDLISVTTVFERIEKDPRHADVAILRHRNLSGRGRDFGDWSMGFKNTSNKGQILRGYLDLPSGQDLLNLDEDRAIKLLARCCEQISQRDAAHT